MNQSIGSSATSPGGNSSGVRPRVYDDVPGKPGLLRWGQVFFGRPGPRLLALAAVAATARRVTLGRWRWKDARVAAAVVGLHPFAEWAVHVYLLHGAGRRRGSEGFSARKHRMHHQEPRNIDLVLLPLPSIALLTTAAGVTGSLVPDRRRGATGAATSLLMILFYEWIHFLIHSPYRPKHAPYRARRRAHRLHHYRNENYWFGVVGTIADRLLGTAPDKAEVPLSGTARTLAGEDTLLANATLAGTTT